MSAGGPATAPRPGRVFDGGLLERHSYTLTRADALALLRLPRELSGREKVALGLWFLAGGAVWGLLPERFVGPEGSWQAIASFLAVIALQFALLWVGRSLWRRVRAWRMVPHPHPAVFEIWVDCIAATDIGGTDEIYLSPELIGRVLDTATHLFVLSCAGALVIPKRAFADAAEADSITARLRELAAGPYYFEA